MLAALILVVATIGSIHQSAPPSSFWATRDSAWWSAVAAFLSFITASVSAIASFRSARQAAVANLRVTRAALSVAFELLHSIESGPRTLVITNGGPGSAQDIRAWVAKEDIYRFGDGNTTIPNRWAA